MCFWNESKMTDLSLDSLCKAIDLAVYKNWPYVAIFIEEVTASCQNSVILCKMVLSAGNYASKETFIV